MNYLIDTQKYYANWLSVNPDLLNQDGIFCSYSPERDCIQEGYSKPFDLYGYFSQHTAIISCGRKLEKEIDWIQESFQISNDLIEFKKAVEEKLGTYLHHDYKYYFSELPSGIDTAKAKQLTEENFPDYLDFFKSQYPESKAETWLASYFKEIASKGYVFGLYIDEKLVSASDSPSMPYMKEQAVEIGINTLPEHRNKGYAKTVLGAMLKFLSSNQKVPIISCASSNTASQKLIQTLGNIKLADVLSLSL